ncbi:hypothetical protein MXB_5716 [Myxobolus squamalis]|nr:hypothetical protein MXB_5716 [Myxobolus squamalis]
MAGGLFAIRKIFFFDSGSYDDKMTFWGGENIEMSFRLWMCGGGILQDKCSVVGHVFRRDSPHQLDSNSVLYNKLRGIEVWMDDYKNIVYERIGVKKYIPAAGNLESRMKLRQNLKCHSFEWYLKNVATHIRVPGPTSTIRNPHTNKCLDVAENKDSGKHVLTYNCHNHGGNQKAFEILREGTIIYDELCLDLSKNDPGTQPTFYSCHSMGGNQQWIFLEENLISHSVTNLCLKIDPKSKYLSTDTCNANDPLQKFQFNYSK